VRAYRVASLRRIEPFGDLVRDLYVGTKTIAAWQEEAASACGLELSDVGAIEEARDRPAIVFSDDVFFTEMALRQFVAAVMAKDGDARIALRDSAILRAVSVLDDDPALEDGAAAFDVFHLAGRASPVKTLEELRARCRPSPIESDEKRIQIRLPHVTKNGAKEIEAPLSARVIARVRHWVHLLRLSELSVGVTLIDRLRRSPWLALRLKLMRGDAWEKARRINFVDPTARVHPTADLECAVIGPGAVVEAHAHVHRSIVGRDVEIGDHAAIVGCTLAEGVKVLRASYFALCAAMPDSTLASYKAQLSLFGRGVFLTTSAWLIDAKLKGDVRVKHEARVVSVNTPFLGVCLGHRVTLGAQVTIQAGRAVPNDSLIVAPPGTFADEVPAYPPGTLLTVRNGRVEPV
jgi:acetyltransferase-like isoleucine patch superfamily enzyme